MLAQTVAVDTLYGVTLYGVTEFNVVRNHQLCLKLLMIKDKAVAMASITESGYLSSSKQAKRPFFLSKIHDGNIFRKIELYMVL